MDSLSCLSVPDENHGFEPNLARGNEGSISVHCKRNDVITVAEFSLGLLLAPLDNLFTASKDLLRPRSLVKNDTESGSHVDTLACGVIVQVLSGQVTLVPVHEVNFVTLIRHRFIDSRHHIWLFDGAQPRLTGHELVSELGRLSIEVVITFQAFGLFFLAVSLSLLVTWQASQQFLLELVFQTFGDSFLQRLGVRHCVPLFILGLVLHTGLLFLLFDQRLLQSFFVLEFCLFFMAVLGVDCFELAVIVRLH